MKKGIEHLTVGEMLTLRQLRKSNESFQKRIEETTDHIELLDTLEKLTANIETMEKLRAIVARRINADAVLMDEEGEVYYARLAQ